MNKEQLDCQKHIQKFLFDKGYLITNAEISNLDSFPFYSNWKSIKIGEYNAFIHSRAKAHVMEDQGKTLLMVGHAYNPFTMVIDEKTILSELAVLHGKQEFFDKLSELTGVFFCAVFDENGKIEIVTDASGMQCCFYGTYNGKQYITSHMRLIGDISDIKTDKFVEKLIGYKWYKYMMGNYLPGDITCYKEMKRVIPNTYVSFDGDKYSIHRFYPNKEIKMCQTEEEYFEVIKEASKILQNTMSIIPQKWEKPAISLTGGIDSNTTFAAANGNYDKYTTFSYVSMYRESVDAQKAKEISEHFNVPFVEYVIPETNEEIEDFELYKAVLKHNDGDIGPVKDNDIRKKVTLMNSEVCDVEVKSWISETIRAYAYKYFGRKKMPKKMKARHWTALYKLFFFRRGLVWETDRHFKDYFEKTELKQHLYNYDESDFFVWEMMHGGKCGLDIGVMKSCFDIDIPYNNRKLLDLLLRVPLEYRINDKHHLDLKKHMNEELFDMNIRVVNLNETKKRKLFANCVFRINSFLPF